MTRLTPRLIIAAATLVAASSAQAAITTVTYGLGDGLSNGSFVSSLVADTSGFNLTGTTGTNWTVVSPATSGVSGSTAQLNDASVGTYYATSALWNATNDFAFQLYFSPATSGGTYIGTSNNNNNSSGAGLLFHAQNSGGGTKFALRNDNGGSQAINALASYSLGTWYQLTGIVYNGTVNFYINGQLQGSVASSTWGTSLLGAPIIGAGSFASAGTTGQFDRISIATFDHTVDSLAGVQASLGGGFTAVPEPSTYGLLGAGALGAAALVRRRRKGVA